MNSEHTYYLISDVNTIYEVDYQTDVIHRSYNGHHGIVLCLRYSPDGTSFISGSDDSSIRLWTVDRNYACFFAETVRFFHPVLHCILHEKAAVRLFSSYPPRIKSQMEKKR